MGGEKGVCTCLGVMRVGVSYLHLFVIQVLGRMGDERLGGHGRRQGVNQRDSSLPHLLRCGVRSAEGLQDGGSEERAPGQGVVGL